MDGFWSSSIAWRSVLSDGQNQSFSKLFKRLFRGWAISCCRAPDRNGCLAQRGSFPFSLRSIRSVDSTAKITWLKLELAVPEDVEEMVQEMQEKLNQVLHRKDR